MPTLLLRLAGPMQSWGLQSRFASVRDTIAEPTKSGVLGLVCAALGKPRAEGEADGRPLLRDLAALRMGVRVDRPGRLMRDYQTAGAETGIYTADGKHRREAVISNRYYLSDASFLVGLEGDETLLGVILAALFEPVWPLYLGRRAFPPADPIEGRIVPSSLETALEEGPWPGRPEEPRPLNLRLVLESQNPDVGTTTWDVPISFAERRFASRKVETKWTTKPLEPKSPTEPSSSPASS